MSGPLPWHQAQWNLLSARFLAGRAPHALLIAGPPESGKALFVEAVAGSLLCRTPGTVCGQCDQCRLLQAGTHPDLHNVTLEESKQIKIEQIRDLIEWANQTSQQGGKKICVISPADKLNNQSANALLKSLEEPPAGTLICLVTDQPNRLLPTLRSRCQRIELQPPSLDEARAWLAEQVAEGTDLDLLLEISGGLPLRAVSTIDAEYLALRQEVSKKIVQVLSGESSPILMAAEFTKAPNDKVLEILYLVISDAIRLSMAGQTAVRNADLLSDITQCASQSSLASRFELLDRVNQAKRALSGTTNANAQMMLEWVLAGD